MAESSRFWATNGTGDGINTGFTVTHWQNLMLKLFEGGEEVSGAVLRGVGSALLPTGTASPITVPPGAAVGYGYFYENDANVSLAITSPVVGTTGGHIVLETNWAAQTVRVKAVKNTDGINSTPALVQTAGTTWQTRLATFTITTGGVITLTDARNLAHFSTEIITTMIRDQAITTAKIADAAVTAVKLAVGAALSNILPSDGAGSGLDADLLDGQHGAFYRLFANLTDTIALAQVPNDLIDDTKLGDRAPQFYRRQGGSASNWFTGGTTTQTPTAVRMQAGVLSLGTISAGSGGTGAVTFPVAFSNVPIVFIVGSPYLIDAGIERGGVNSGAPIASGFRYEFINNGGSAQPSSLLWLAIGPE